MLVVALDNGISKHEVREETRLGVDGRDGEVGKASGEDLEVPDEFGRHGFACLAEFHSAVESRLEGVEFLVEVTSLRSELEHFDEFGGNLDSWDGDEVANAHDDASSVFSFVRFEQTYDAPEWASDDAYPVTFGEHLGRRCDERNFFGVLFDGLDEAAHLDFGHDEVRSDGSVRCMFAEESDAVVSRSEFVDCQFV